MKKNTMEKYAIVKENSAVTTNTLSAEELAKYQKPDVQPSNKPVYTACGKEVVNREKALPKVPKKEYTPKEYTTSDNDLLALGMDTAYNAMKRKYEKRGLEDYNPNKNISAREEYEGNSILAVMESLTDMILELDDKGIISNEDMHQIKTACYKACERNAYLMKREARKHLYIETLIPDEDGETMITQIEDVTASIEHEEDFELWELLKPYTTIEDRRILKWRAKRYTTETCCKRLNCTKRTYFRKLKKARAHAQKALKGTDFER